MQDLRDALRALRATPLVTLVAVLSLALGIGANTAMFSIVDRLLLRSLPVPEADRLALIDTGEGSTTWTNPIWEQIRDRPDLFGGAFAWSFTRFNLARSGQADYVNGIWASGRFFDLLRVPAALGRTFGPADDRRGGGPEGAVAVISYPYWQSRFGGAADVIGRSLTLNRVAFTIVGVTPPEFFGPEVGRRFDVAIPIGTEPLIRGDASSLDRRSTWWLRIMVRLKAGQTVAQAQSALAAVQPQIREATLPDHWRPQDLAQYLTDPLVVHSAAAGTSFLRDRYRCPLTAIMVVVALVLLIACGNIANLLLARATARRHEMSLRQALGASRWRLTRQLLAESVLLSLAGGALGALLALWGSRLLIQALATGNSTVFLAVGFDWQLLGFTAAIAVGTALLFGTAPALRAAGAQPIEAIKDQGRGSAGEGRGRLAGGLVVAQVALSLILVIGAGLFVRTFAGLADLDLGFRQDGVLVANIGAERSQVPADRRVELYQQLRDAAAALPGVSSAALSAVTPVSGTTWNERIEVPGGIERPEEERVAYMNVISPGWFETLGTPVLAGRDLSRRDVAGGRRAVVVNEAFVKKFLGNANPLGRTVRREFRPGEAPKIMEIVGVVKDAVYNSVRSPIPPTMYLPLTQDDIGPYVALSVRAKGGSPALLARPLTGVVVGIDPDLNLSFKVLTDQIADSLTQERVVAMLSAFFGGLALLLAGLGLYGVTSYSVNRRKAEIGIRMALGAAPGGVLRFVLRRVAVQVGLGVAIGVGVSWWLSRLVASLLYGLAPGDLTTTVVAALVLAAVGAAAGWLPARRAARIDPAIVLREG